MYARSLTDCHQVAPLQDRFTCYGVDLRGHGDSPSGPGTDLLYHGEDVCTVVRSLGLEGERRVPATRQGISKELTSTQR